MKQLLIIGYVWVEPNSSAAGSRMQQLIELFLKDDYKITFASTSQKSEKALDLSVLGINEVKIELNSSSFDDFIKALNPSIVLFDRFMIEEQFGWRVKEHCKYAIRILDTEDLHSLRKVRQECLKKGTPFSNQHLLSSDIAKREVASILRCDVSLIISSFEMNLLSDVFKIDKSLLCYLPFLLDKIDVDLFKNQLSFSEREHFVFIGNFLHAPNVDAVLQLKKIWKLIKDKLPKVELHIYGAYVTQQILQLHNPKERFLIKGYADNAVDVVKKSKVVLAPLRFGAGIKGKLTEAMVCGTPSVTTSIGAEGMVEGFLWNGFIEDDFEIFSIKAITLYTDESKWSEAQKNGVTIINSVYEKNKLTAGFLAYLKNLKKDLTSHREANFIGSLLHHQTMKATKYMSKWIEEKNK